MRTPFLKDQRVKIRPEFCSQADAQIIHLVIENEDGGRTSISPAAGQGFDEMRIKPVERIETYMLEVAP